MMAVLADRLEIAQMIFKKAQKLVASSASSPSTTEPEDGQGGKVDGDGGGGGGGSGSAFDGGKTTSSTTTTTTTSYLETKDRGGRTALHCAAHKVCRRWGGGAHTMPSIFSLLDPN